MISRAQTPSNSPTQQRRTGRSLREAAVLAAMLAGMAWHGQGAQAAGISGQGTWETTLLGRDLDGNVANGFEAYYDTELNITWLTDANYARTSSFDTDGRMSWATANSWAQSLIIAGISGWRLPQANPVNGQAYGPGDTGSSITSPNSELAHLYWSTLKNKITGLADDTVNFGPFNNTNTKGANGIYYYWTSNTYPTATNTNSDIKKYFFFDTSIGFQYFVEGTFEAAAWAVHPGDVAVYSTAKWLNPVSGSWESAGSWTNTNPPAVMANVSIDPTRSLTVTGPAANASIQSLFVGGDGSGNLGIATLNLIGSTLTTSGDATIQSQGVLSGEGTLASANIVNHGLVQAGNLVFNTAVFDNHGSLSGNRIQVNSPISNNYGTIHVARGSFSGVLTNLGQLHVNQLTVVDGVDNQGTLTGHGQLNGSVTNYRNGMVKVNAGQRLEVTQWAQNNAGGTFDLVGGDFQTTSDSLNNQSGGRILMGNGTRLSAGGPGLINQGQVLMSYGTASVSGQVTNAWGGQIIASGNSNITFYDNTELQSGSELRVAQGSSVTFFGLVEQRTGAKLTGTGSKFFEGGLSVGASPGLGVIAGDVGFGLDNELLIELGGDTACTLACATDDALKNSSHDKLAVGGTLSLGGTLRLVSWNSFVAQAGMRFDVLDWGNVDGTFDAIDATGFLLASGATLDLSKLYVDGSISVVGTTPAVPEPGSLALALAGAAVLGYTAKRRNIRITP
jgi:hypothetical protein